MQLQCLSMVLTMHCSTSKGISSLQLVMSHTHVIVQQASHAHNLLLCLLALPECVKVAAGAGPQQAPYLMYHLKATVWRFSQQVLTAPEGQGMLCCGVLMLLRFVLLLLMQGSLPCQSDSLISVTQHKSAALNAVCLKQKNGDSCQDGIAFAYVTTMILGQQGTGIMRPRLENFGYM